MLFIMLISKIIHKSIGKILTNQKNDLLVAFLIFFTFIIKIIFINKNRYKII